MVGWDEFARVSADLINGAMGHSISRLAADVTIFSAKVLSSAELSSMLSVSSLSRVTGYANQ